MNNQNTTSPQITEDPQLLRRLTKNSKKLAWILRHGATQEKLAMDEAGWVSVDELCRYLKLSFDELELATIHNNKSRYELRDDKIRASQGHSLNKVPVTQAALEASWDIYHEAGPIWHGTNRGVIDAIRSGGILRGERSHVHLASSITSKVGKRHNISVLVEVSQEKLREAGYEIYISPNGVILTRYVPVSCIENVWGVKKGERFLM